MWYILTAILLIALDLFLLVFFFFPSFVSFSYDLMTNFRVVFLFLFLFWVYIVLFPSFPTPPPSKVLSGLLLGVVRITKRFPCLLPSKLVPYMERG